MADRELLELAAKAAGHTFSWLNGAGAIEARKPGIMQPYIPWNPLTNDGDALRLAVRLRQMHVHIDVESTSAFRNDVHGMPAEWAGEPHGSDPYAATRRAIVRAAAEIGRNMK